MEKLIEHFAENGEEHEAVSECKDKCLNHGIPSCHCGPMMKVRKKLFQYESTGLMPDEIPQWHDGPLPKCGPEEMPWFVIEAPSWIGGLPDYEVVRWMGEHWSDKRADRAEKWMKLSLPQPPKEEK